jgi:signal peptidase I
VLKTLLVGRHPRRTAIRAAILVALCAVVFGVVLRPVRAHGVSMTPTILDGDLVFLNTLAYALGRPIRRGDVVGIRLTGPNLVYVKRVVALPYERVAILAGQVLVDGQRVDEPYVRHRAPWEYAQVQLGEDEYFVVGDNRGMQQEWHDFGRVSRDRIRGKVVFW